MSADDLSHSDLQESLARWLRLNSKNSVVLTELALAGSFASEGRLDVVRYTAYKSYTGALIHGFEVKNTRADLLGDISSGKYQKYLPYCNRFFFAIREGIATAEEIPEGMGLLVFGGGRFGSPYWREERKATRLPGEGIDASVIARLAYRAGRVAEMAKDDIRIRAFNEKQLRGRIKDLEKRLDELRKKGRK